MLSSIKDTRHHHIFYFFFKLVITRTRCLWAPPAAQSHSPPLRWDSSLPSSFSHRCMCTPLVCALRVCETVEEAGAVRSL